MIYQDLWQGVKEVLEKLKQLNTLSAFNQHQTEKTPTKTAKAIPEAQICEHEKQIIYLLASAQPDCAQVETSAQTRPEGKQPEGQGEHKSNKDCMNISWQQELLF